MRTRTRKHKTRLAELLRAAAPRRSDDDGEDDGAAADVGDDDADALDGDGMRDDPTIWAPSPARDRFEVHPSGAAAAGRGSVEAAAARAPPPPFSSGEVSLVESIAGLLRTALADADLRRAAVEHARAVFVLAPTGAVGERTDEGALKRTKDSILLATETIWLYIHRHTLAYLHKVRVCRCRLGSVDG